MFEDMDRDARLLLLKFVCAFAWTDLKVRSSERRFVKRLVERLELNEDDRDRVEAWLNLAPSPGDINPADVPVEHRRTFVEALRAVMYADSEVDDEEREHFEQLRAALGH